MTASRDYIKRDVQWASFQKNVVSGRENGAKTLSRDTITGTKQCSNKLEQFVLVPTQHERALSSDNYAQLGQQELQSG
jgi:hypothetical protein